MSLALLCFCCFLHGVWWSRHWSPQEWAGRNWLGGVQCHKIRTPAHTEDWHKHVCACTHPIPKQGRYDQPGCYPSAPRGAEGTSPPPDPLMGNSSGWAELLYLLTGYLENLLNPNCMGEVCSPQNCHQPDSRQDLKHRPALRSMYQVILPHFCRQVIQTKDHTHHKDSIVLSFQGYSAPAVPVTFSYNYQC